MKTNVVLQSPDRNLLGVNVSVMSKDGYVCITEANIALSKKRESLGLAAKKIGDILETQSFRERCYELVNKLEDKKFISIERTGLKNKIDSIKSIKDLSKIGLAYKKGRNENQLWYVNPYLFVMIVMEMDPEMYAEVIIWIHDGLIGSRNVAGDAYIKMCSAIYGMVDNNQRDNFKDVIASIAKAINYIVFNDHQDGIRNSASKDQLNDIITLENNISTLVEDGFIKTYPDLMQYLREKWVKVWRGVISKLEVK